MPYKDPLTADTVLVRGAIQSPNYVPGVSGWIVRQNGTAEFLDLIARGTITADQIKTSDVETDARLWINNPAGDKNQILFYKEDQNDATPIKELARISANDNVAQKPGLRLYAWGEPADSDFVGMQVVGGAAGTGVGALIELTSPDALDHFAVRSLFRINGERILSAPDILAREVSASANQNLTNAFVDIAGMSLTFTPPFDSDVSIAATFDELVSVGIGAGGLAIHRCVVDGVVQPRTPYELADTPHRGMTSGAWVVNGLSGGNPHTIKFQVQKSINAGTVQLQSSVTGAAITILGNG